MNNRLLREAWRARDELHALVPEDRRLVAEIDGARELVIDHAQRALLRGEVEPDLYDACSALGWVVGREGGSPTLAASMIDGLRDALGGTPPVWLEPARAALLEAYVAARLDQAHEAARKAWEYPLCTVSLGGGRMAIAAGYPDDDGERLAEWAARVARGAVRDGIRLAQLAGGEPQRAALSAALDLAGIALDPPPRRTGRGRVRTWLPWRR